MTENHSFNHILSLPFLDEIFSNSSLCQICEFANYGIGGICSLLLNRRMPNIIVKDSRIISCSAHSNWFKKIIDDGKKIYLDEPNSHSNKSDKIGT